MNRKLVIKNSSGEIVYCVLRQEEPYEEQLEKVFSINSGCGFSVMLNKKSVVIRDYYAGENRAELEIISFKTTKLPQMLYWEKE